MGVFASRRLHIVLPKLESLMRTLVTRLNDNCGDRAVGTCFSVAREEGRWKIWASMHEHH